MRCRREPANGLKFGDCGGNVSRQEPRFGAQTGRAADEQSTKAGKDSSVEERLGGGHRPKDLHLLLNKRALQSRRHALSSTPEPNFGKCATNLPCRGYFCY